MGADKHEKHKHGKLPRHVRCWWHAEQSGLAALSPGRAVRLHPIGGAIQDGRNNGRISLAGERARKKLCWHEHVHAHGRSNSVHGFIVPVKRGTFTLKVKHAAEWRLTEQLRPTQEAATKDFMKWTPEIQNTVPEWDHAPDVGPQDPGWETVRNVTKSITPALRKTITPKIQTSRKSSWVRHL